jgi:hypothetical protein
MFINYSTQTGLSINTFRTPSGYANSDIIGLVDDICAGKDSCCPLDGSKAALEDGSLWAECPDETLEDLHALICEHEKNAIGNKSNTDK